MVGCIVFGSCITHETPSSVALVAVFGVAALESQRSPDPRGLCSQLDIPFRQSKKLVLFRTKAHNIRNASFIIMLNILEMCVMQFKYTRK